MHAYHVVAPDYETPDSIIDKTCRYLDKHPDDQIMLTTLALMGAGDRFEKRLTSVVEPHIDGIKDSIPWNTWALSLITTDPDAAAVILNEAASRDIATPAGSTSFLRQSTVRATMGR